MVNRHPSRRIHRTKKTPDDLMDTFLSKINELSRSVKTDYLRSEILSKYVSDDTDPPNLRRTRAINKWLATEAENSSTNERLLITHEEYNILPRVSFSEFVQFCRNIISDVIGDTVPVDALIGSFSGGASTSRSRTESYPSSKYLGRAHVTQPCLDVWLNLIKPEIPVWLMGSDEPHYEVVPGNVLFTVPKKTDIDRCACKEPDVNMFVQKGVGAFFRKRLQQIGINLNDQSINRSLARIGSIDNSLATLDLSSASDSVSTGLVALLLPECWFTLLDSIRSQVTIIDGEIHRNEMFSSMGNGFTFELESLLFYTLTRATCYFRGISGKVSVYGDDIICPSSAYHYLTFVLNYFGFSVNEQKSFCTDNFRESCGGHYFNGHDVTPFYIRQPISTESDLIHLANQLREWAVISDAVTILDPEVEPIWLWLKSLVSDDLWGGCDTSFKFQLVSYDIPKMRLYLETHRKDTELGGYYHWLNATWHREFFRSEVVTSRLTLTSGRLRRRRVRDTSVPRLTAYFYSEIVDVRVTAS